MRRTAAASAVLAATVAMLAPAAASASITVGSDLSDAPITIDQTCAPAASPCTDLLVNVNAGNLYPVESPATGTVTAFSIRSGTADTVTFRLLRYKLAVRTATGAATGPTVTLPGPGIHTFPASLPIQHGTYLGIDITVHRATENLPCTSQGATLLYNPILTNGGPFEPTDANSICELLVQATIEPSNAFKLGKIGKVKRGKAILPITLPGPGTLTLKGKGVKPRKSKAKAAGKANLAVRPRGGVASKLDSSGKARTKVKVTYLPTGGVPLIKKPKLKLKS